MAANLPTFAFECAANDFAVSFGLMEFDPENVNLNSQIENVGFAAGSCAVECCRFQKNEKKELPIESVQLLY